VDNSADVSESDFLRKQLPHPATLHLSSENIGFGKACNWVLNEHDTDLILLLNPDAVLLPNCLIQLQKTLLSSKRIGAVGPQIYWDRKGGYFLPPSYPPALLMLNPLLSLWGPYSRAWRLISAFWRRYAVYIWKAKSPVRVCNLSGGNVLVKKEAVVNSGGLFDPRFFLYYEDTDLFIRLRKEGYKLYVEPCAEVIHYYDQCDVAHLEDKRYQMRLSQKMFMKKHLHGWRKSLIRQLSHLFKAKKICIEPEIKATYNSTFMLSVPEILVNGWLFEWSPNSNFVPAAGKFGTGSLFEFSENEWRLMAPGRYYGRLSNASGWGGAVKEIAWEKTR
jgi:GT2 family glycosyltransferase